jgi:hypothetical protein
MFTSPIWCRIDNMQHLSKDVKLRAGSIYAGYDGRVALVNKLRVGVECAQPRAHFLLGVIWALHQPRDDPLLVWRVELAVADGARDWVQPASDDSLYEELVWHIEHNHSIQDDASVVQCASLGLRAREAIQQPPAVLPRQSFSASR